MMKCSQLVALQSMMAPAVRRLKDFLSEPQPARFASDWGGLVSHLAGWGGNLPTIQPNSSSIIYELFLVTATQTHLG